MIWESPQLLWLLLLLPLLWFAGRYFDKIHAGKIRRFFSDELVQKLSSPVNKRNRSIRKGLVYTGLFFILTGMAGPKIGSEIREVTRDGVDLLIALDVSRSMLAEDVRPNRLDKAKFELASLVGQLQGDRIGLLLFSNTAFLQCPLTTDYSAFRMYLDLASTEQLPVPGTDFNAPLREASRVFSETGRTDAARVLLFVSDGEDHSPSFDESLRQLRDQGVIVFTVGIGSLSGAQIPVFDPATGRRAGFHRDRQGQVVNSRLEPDNLRKMSSETGGLYYEIRRGNDRLDGFISQLGELERRQLASEQFSDYANRYQYPLALGILLLMCSALLPEYRKVVE
ncbi:MAG: VWA domain-containing protein [Balneolales bacterium]|nr:VWA domain-containing protein [Balneolales bacterium]